MPDHRSCPRWQVDWQARLKLEGQEEYTSCTLRDINFKGARIHSEQKFTQDTRLKLSLCLTQDCYLEIEAWVCWHKTIEGVNVYGLYFTKIKDGDKEKIYRFIQSHFGGQLSKQRWEGVSRREEGEGEKMSEDRRVFERFAVNLPLRYLDLHQNREGAAQACDVSAKGLGFITNEDLPAQTPLEIWIQLPDKEEPFYSRAEVAWSKPVGFNQRRVGVSLDKAELGGFVGALGDKK